MKTMMENLRRIFSDAGRVEKVAALNRALDRDGRAVGATMKAIDRAAASVIKAVPVPQRWHFTAPSYLPCRESPVSRIGDGRYEKKYTLLHGRSGDGLQVAFRDDGSMQIAPARLAHYCAMQGPAIAEIFSVGAALYDGPADAGLAQRRIDNFMESTLGAKHYNILKDIIAKQNAAAAAENPGPL